ncbi:YqzE family protein [Paenibacillus alkalitolerans]|uniref:YqzE family protein n=1 Tax=Paenibacillus alkalitolerans TaxID=2799335 RepID=UPI0018F7B7C7|nr:YqzE family protein [Paenibacillus alkalitolerans]
MAKGEELVKYVTEKVVSYIDMPPEERKHRKLERKQTREPWGTRLFGMLPMALSMFFGSRRNKKAPSAKDD